MTVVWVIKWRRPDPLQYLRDYEMHRKQLVRVCWASRKRAKQFGSVEEARRYRKSIVRKVSSQEWKTFIGIFRLTR